MARLKLFWAVVVLTFSAGLAPWTLQAQHGVFYRAPTSDGSYCHLKFPAIREDTLSWSQPILKDRSSGDIVDFYGPCNYDPHGKDAIQSQKLDMQRRWQRQYNN